MDQSIALPFGLDRVAASDHPLVSAIVGMVLYGSWARGETTETSDIDVLLVMEPTFPIRRELYTVLDSIQGIDPRISISLVHQPNDNQEPSGIWLEIARDGVILADTHSQIANTINSVRQLIAAGKRVRHETHGQGYWVHA